MKLCLSSNSNIFTDIYNLQRVISSWNGPTSIVADWTRIVQREKNWYKQANEGNSGL